MIHSLDRQNLPALAVFPVLAICLTLAAHDATAQEPPAKDLRVLSVWGTESGNELAAVPTLSGDSFTLSAGPGATRVITIAPDETITVWDARTGELLAAVPGREDDLHVFEELCASCKKRLGLRNFQPALPVPAPADAGPDGDGPRPAPADPVPDDTGPGPVPARDEEAPSVPQPGPPQPEDVEGEGDPPISLSSIPAPDPDLAAQVNPQLDRMLDKPQRELARAVILPLGEKIVPVLKTRMYDRELTIRWEVVNLIGQLKAASGIPIVADRILNDHDHHVRWRAIWSMNQLRNRAAFVTAFRPSIESQSSVVAWRAAVGLSALSEPDPICLDAIHRGVDDADEGKVWEAINALGRVWNEQSASVLARVFSRPFLRGRQEAALSLGNIGGPTAVETLKRGLADTSHQVRWRAARSLGRVGDAGVIPPLREQLRIETDEFTRKKIQEALERLGASR